MQRKLPYTILLALIILAAGCTPSATATTAPVQTSAAAGPTATPIPVSVVTKVATVSGYPTQIAYPTPTQASGLFNVDAHLKTLQVASYAFNTPDSLRLGTPFYIHLLISPSEPVQVLVTAVPQTGKVEGGEIRVDTLMVARLTGGSFKIEPMVEEEQALSFMERTEWIWKITPQAEGEQYLYLTVYAKIKTPDGQVSRQIKTLERRIVVNVTLSQRISGFVSKNWQWLWAAVLVPAVTFGLQRYTKRKKKPVSGGYKKNKE